MRRGFIICSWLLLGGIFISYLDAQELNVRNSSMPVKETGDTIVPIVDKKAVTLADSLIFLKEDFKPDPKKAVIYSAIFPGLGQIYNRKYWKLPIVYGGFVGFAYAISWNGGRYNEYYQAYYDLVKGTGDSWIYFLKANEDPNTISESRKTELAASLRRRKDYFRRNRDLSIIAMVGFYGLCMIDAYVDAHLYDFDMSPDLSMRIAPVFWGGTQYSKPSLGLQCSITF